MAALLTLVLLAAVIAVIATPLLLADRRSRRWTIGRHPPLATDSPAARAELQAADLEAAREAKYREIRDAELDYRTGKLSREDYEAVDGSLRAEAIAILDALRALEPERPVS